MYANHMPKIADHALATPDGLSDLIEFVLCTIQQPLQQVIPQRRDIRQNGLESRFLFGSKRHGMAYVQEHALDLWSGVRAILAAPDSAERKADLIQHFMQVPGLGMVKAAFVVQCLGGGTACIDSHNMKRLGLSEGALRVGPKLKPETARRKVEAYVALCDETGGSEFWWDTWCEHVAGRRGSPLKTGHDVSAYHVEAVCLVA